MNNKQEALSMLNCSVDQNMNLKASNYEVGDFPNKQTADLSCYHYWQDWYYPQVIKESYPVYIQERAIDKGKQAFEIIKILKDKKLVNLNKVSDFIDLMDELIKIL